MRLFIWITIFVILLQLSAFINGTGINNFEVVKKRTWNEANGITGHNDPVNSPQISRTVKYFDNLKDVDLARLDGKKFDEKIAQSNDGMYYILKIRPSKNETDIIYKLVFYANGRPNGQVDVPREISNSIKKAIGPNELKTHFISSQQRRKPIRLEAIP